MRYLRGVLRSLAMLLLALGAVSCTDRQPTTAAGPLPVLPTAYPSPTGELRVARPSEDIQDLDVEIENGDFTADRYSVQSWAVRMSVSAEGGPYTFSIDRLVEPRVIAPGGTAVIALTVPEPGDYTMRITGTDEDSAVLSVRPVGGR